MLLGIVLVGTVVVIMRFKSIELSLRILKRMKWFFLSILIVYLWFTPGSPVIDSSLPGIPTVEGISTGLLRVMSLMLIIFAVNYFVSAIARTILIEAIVWLLTPLSWAGIDNKVVALRIALVLELLPKVQNIVLDVKQEYKDQRTGLNAGSRRNKVVSILVTASRLLEQLFVRIVDEAVEMPAERISVATSRTPPVVQWVVPVLLIAAFLWSKNL